MRSYNPLLPSLSVLLGLFAASVSQLTAQGGQRITGWDRVSQKGEHQYDVQLLRPAGGPVVPIFDGWYINEDGTRELCFGYFNVNTEEVIEIPIGPNNFIEPSEFDGVQPTEFLPVGATPTDAGRRSWCIFTVQIPQDYTGDVRWTVIMDGDEYSSPGRTRFTQYLLQAEEAPDLRVVTPVLKLSVDGPVLVGPDGNHHMAGPVYTKVGEPLTLPAWTRRDNPYGTPIIEGFTPLGTGEDSRPIAFTWFKHQGPGDVDFSQRTVSVTPDSWQGAAEAFGQASVEATFSEAGEYVLRVTNYSDPTSFTHFCCWTNGFISVIVSN